MNLTSTLRLSWHHKIEDCAQHRPTLGKWANRLWDFLLDSDSNGVSARNDSLLAKRCGIPIKYFFRSLYILMRYGLVRFDSTTHRLTARPPKTLKSGRLPSQRRKFISEKMRRHIYHSDGGRCAATGEYVSWKDVHIDHIIPIAFGGADEFGNMTIMFSKQNSQKRADIDPFAIKYYRKKTVNNAIGMRKKRGFYWPVINGKVRTETWPKT